MIAVVWWLKLSIQLTVLTADVISAGITKCLAGKKTLSLFDTMFLDGYPPVHTRDLDARIWLDNYIQTYIERDVRQLINVRDL